MIYRSRRSRFHFCIALFSMYTTSMVFLLSQITDCISLYIFFSLIIISEISFRLSVYILYPLTINDKHVYFNNISRILLTLSEFSIIHSATLQASPVISSFPTACQVFKKTSCLLEFLLFLLFHVSSLCAFYHQTVFSKSLSHSSSLISLLTF